MRRRLVLISAIAALFIVTTSIENLAVRSKPADPADNVSAVYRLAGEFRTVAANLLWIKADGYHHEFVQTNPHWCDNRDLLGMMKIITALDPRFEEAYSTGAYILMYGCKNPRRAVAYLNQGIAINPKSSELNHVAALVYAQKLKDPERALPYAQRAARYAEDDWNRQLTTRLLHTIRKMIADQPPRKHS